MIRTMIQFSDGTILSSGVPGGNAISGVTLTESVNSGEDLLPGSVCASMVEGEFITPGGIFSPQAGEVITLFREQDGQTYPVGIFQLEKPERISANRLKITGYDRVILLEKDLSQWLNALDGWPYRLEDFASMVCNACGLTLRTQTLPNGDWEVPAFGAQSITGRTLMGWIGQICNRFCRANCAGEIEFGWYTQTDKEVTPGGENYFYQDSLQYGDYQVAPIQKVQIQSQEEDVGVLYPPDISDGNTYTITGNMLLSAETPETLAVIAQSIYEEMKEVSYTPGKVRIAGECDIRPGEIITVTDRNGKTITFYVMSRKQTGQSAVLECTGNRLRGQRDATNEERYQALQGKMLLLKKTIDGLQVENRDLAGKSGELSLTVDGLNARFASQETEVQSAKSQVSELTQKTDGLQLSLETVITDGATKVKTQTGYEFSDAGLKIQKSGEEMENRLDHTGMYVHRAGETILQANNAGVTATDVQVRNFLMVGEHARFEDYENDTDSRRTGCYFI